MKRFAISCLLLLIAALPAHAEKPDPQIFGRWKIVSVAGFAGVIADSAIAESKQLLGAELFLERDGIQFAGQNCKNPSFSVQRTTLAQAFLIGFKMPDYDKLKLPDPATEIEVECESPTDITYLYVRSKDQIVFVWSGIFFNAVKRK